MTNKLKNNWNKVDEKCPTCNSMIKKATGLNKQNLKRLCFSKPSLQDLIILSMLIGCLLMAYFYVNEVRAYKEIIANPAELCTYYYYNNMLQNTGGGIDLIDGQLNGSVNLNEDGTKG